MKYMGHKGKLLQNGLSEVLLEHSRNAEKIADPFCGSAAVSWFLAQKTNKAIISGDIQTYAVIRARAVVERIETFNPDDVIKNWFRKTKRVIEKISNFFPNGFSSFSPDLSDISKIQKAVKQSRSFCSDVLPFLFDKTKGIWPITKAYGGHYFSPNQALIFDALRRTIPAEVGVKEVALASLVEAASLAVASPGHTAQPFQPTKSASPYIAEAWMRDPFLLTENAFKEIAQLSAQAIGRGVVGDFSKTISHLKAGDMVFADPPYSGVHYSRFYHVLETIVRGIEFAPEGKGRYPAIEDRPSSAFSMKSVSFDAAKKLLETCKRKKVTLVLTFPTDDASNGLSSQNFKELGKSLFGNIKEEIIDSDFSTLGGNKKHREARQTRKESIITFLP